jgi:hypothetical protein
VVPAAAREEQAKITAIADWTPYSESEEGEATSGGSLEDATLESSRRNFNGPSDS